MGFCRKTTFSELYTLDFEITNFFAMRQKWRAGTEFRMEHPRRANGLILLCGATGKYTGKTGSFFAPTGSVVCLPEESKYAVLNLSDGKEPDYPDAYLIEFRTFSQKIPLTFDDSPFLIKNANFVLLRELAEKTVLACEAPVNSPCTVRAGIYEMLSLLGESSLEVGNKRFSPIMPGIEYLRKNPQSSLSVEELAKMCHVSSANFRKLFKEYSGKSPASYRIDRKLELAKRMLESEKVSFTYIAEALGFESEAYFSRLFKKKLGCSPSVYRETKLKGYPDES